MAVLARIAVVLTLGLAAFAAPLHADDLTDKQPSYTRIAAKCGEDPSRPSFAVSDYVNALKDAAAALKSAKKEGNRARQTAITESVARLKECQQEEVRKFPMEPMRNCREFLNVSNKFAAWAAPLLTSGKITIADRDRIREGFRSAAEACVRDMMSKCIDPTKTSDVDFVIDVMDAASSFRFIYSYHAETGLDRLLTTTNPGFLRMSFCTDTDHACKGDKAACKKRVDRIEAIMETYMHK